MITFHLAQIAEVSKIKDLLHQTWTTTYSHIYSPQAIETITSKRHSIDLLSKQIQDKTAFFGVAKDGDKIVGMCNASLTHGGKNINIQRLHISPSYQRQGIGTRLIAEVFKNFPNAKSVDLEVEQQNNRAYDFYQKQGFQKVGTKVFKVDNIPLPCIVMKKNLTR